MKPSRYIDSGLCEASANMAIDEAMLNAYREGISKPVLRIYGWQKASFSFGYSQNPAALFHLHLCEKEHVPVVRRPTGGGLIFHHDELTYSLVLSQSDLGTNLNVKETLKEITLFIMRAYQILGARACFAAELNGPSGSSSTTRKAKMVADFCFSRKEEYDIVIKGKKIGGNAQKRKKRLILQHGSIPFSFEKEKIARFLKNPRTLKKLDIASVNEITNKKVSFANLSEILKDAFCRHFSTKLEKSELSKEEKTLAQQLEQEKYANPQWNLYRQVGD